MITDIREDVISVDLYLGYLFRTGSLHLSLISLVLVLQLNYENGSHASFSSLAKEFTDDFLEGSSKLS